MAEPDLPTPSHLPKSGAFANLIRRLAGSYYPEPVDTTAEYNAVWWSLLIAALLLWALLSWRYIPLRAMGWWVMKNRTALLAWSLLLLFIVFVWPTRYRTIDYDPTVRADRLTGNVQVYMPQFGWVNKASLASGE